MTNFVILELKYDLENCIETTVHKFQTFQNINSKNYILDVMDGILDFNSNLT